MGTSGGKSTVTLLKAEVLPTVWIYPTAYYTMSLWASLAGKQGYEFTCLGRCVQEKDELYVTDAYMVKHEGTSASVDMDDGDQIMLMMKLESEGFDGVLVDTKGPVPPDEIRCWTHSHPGTGPSATYWSGIDDACIERFLTGPFCVSIVFDSEGRNPKCRIDLKEPRVQITADLQIYVPWLTEEQETKATALFKEKSSRAGFNQKNKYPSHSRGSQAKGYGNYGSGRYSGHDDFDGYPDYGQHRGNYSGSRSTTTTSTSKPTTSTSTSKTPTQTQAVAEDHESDDEIRERIMSLFALRKDQVEEEWITWAKEHTDEFGEWTFDGEEDHQTSLLDAEYQMADLTDAIEGTAALDTLVDNLGPSDEALEEYERLIGERTGEIIPLSDIKDLEAGIEVVDMTGESDDEDTAWIADAEVRSISDYEEPANGDEAAASEDQTSDDTVPDAQLGDRMKEEAIAVDIKTLAAGVASKSITLKDAVETICKRHDISTEKASEAFQSHLGA